jgi:serine/threonine protein kinase/Tol biopolymer transport system component
VQVFNRWEEVERLFHAALEQDPAHRTEFLSRICTDPDVLAEVNSLLEAHEKGGSVLDQPPDRIAAEFLEEFASRQDSLVGSAFDHYQITGVLGEGGMGKVYVAQDSRLMRKVALKILPAPHVQSLERLRRFAQEARVASALNHPNIITVYDYGQALSSYYIATEYVEGQTLRVLIRDGINIRAALEIAMQMASAFAAAHQAGIIHRDIKPENIMVRADGLVKVLDFGLAKLAPQSDPITSLGDSPTTVPGAVIGTFCYMSPEQARGKELDPRTDIFSFGIVLYEMLAGRRPFEGEELPDLLTSLVGSDPPPLSTYVPEAPVELETILAGALARDRDDRYQSFEALLADLTAVRARLETSEDQKIPFQTSLGVRSSGSVYGVLERAARAKVTKDPRGSISGSGGSVIAGPRVGFRGYLIVAIVMLSAAVVLWRVMTNHYPVLVEADRVAKVTYDGKASVNAVSVSPDGKHFAYVRENALSILTMPASEQENAREINNLPCPKCAGSTFSIDGQYIYYVAGDTGRRTLYRRQIADEQSEVITEDVNGSVSFSPRGDRFVFVRNSKRALLTANADGTDERNLAVADHGGDNWLYPAWSPDGKRVACGIRNPDKTDEEIYVVNMADGKKEIVRSSMKWVRVGNLAWISDRELILNATGEQTQSSCLWVISYPSGDAHKLTTDLSQFFGASLTADSRRLFSVRVDYSMDLYAGSVKDPGNARKVNLGPLMNYGSMGLCWTPDAKVIYSAGPVQRSGLYVYDPSGPGGGEPLTAAEGDSFSPAVTADNRYVVFASDRDGLLSIWRTNRDGSNPTKLAAGGSKPSALFDGDWVVYQATGENNRTSLWKVSIEGEGDRRASRLTDPQMDAENPAVSPDGRRVACVLKQAAESSLRIAVIAAGRQSLDTYDLPTSVHLPIIRWRDDETLLYIDQTGEGSDIWQQRLDHRLGGPQRLGSSSRPDFNSILNFDCGKDDKLVLSAGAVRRDVVELALRPHR